MKKLFGTDGIRGIVGKDLTTDLSFRLARVFGTIIARDQPPGPWIVVIGRDTRSSCDTLEDSICAGLTAQGVNVSLAGVIPTPGLAYLTRTGGFNGGVMISASHNPAEYNGIKFVSQDGFKITEKEEFEIEQALENYDQTRFPEVPHGTIKRDPTLPIKYLDYLRQVENISLGGLKVVMDLSNGATFSIGPTLFADLGANIVSIADKPDG